MTFTYDVTVVTNESRCAWILLSYRIPREPSTPRIALWRKFKRLGTAQVGDGLVALPEDARTQEQLEWAADEIAEVGGSSTLWTAELISLTQERMLMQQMADARASEYSEIAERAIIARSSTTVDAVRQLRSLRRELRKVQRRDFFPPAERDRARAEVQAFAETVLADEKTATVGMGS